MFYPKRKLICLAVVCAILSLTAQSQNTSQPKGARATVRSFFSLLKSGAYAALYDFLPSQLQRQTTREQLSSSLKRLESFITIERMEIGRVQERGDFAVVDTTIYGRLKQPLKLNDEEIKEGRFAAQQFLFREAGRWKIATADNRTQSFFLKRNPEFSKQFQITQPKFEFKQSGEWKAMGRKTVGVTSSSQSSAATPAFSSARSSARDPCRLPDDPTDQRLPKATGKRIARRAC